MTFAKIKYTSDMIFSATIWNNKYTKKESPWATILQMLFMISEGDL